LLSVNLTAQEIVHNVPNALYKGLKNRARWNCFVMPCRKMEIPAFKLECQRNISYVHVESFGGEERIIECVAFVRSCVYKEAGVGY